MQLSSDDVIEIDTRLSKRDGRSTAGYTLESHLIDAALIARCGRLLIRRGTGCSSTWSIFRHSDVLLRLDP